MASWGSGANSLEFIVPPVDAITSFVGKSATITSSSNGIDAGAKAARGKDVALVFVNAFVFPHHAHGNLLICRDVLYRMSGELGSYNVVVGNMGDRNDLKLWYDGDNLVSFDPLSRSSFG